MLNRLGIKPMFFLFILSWVSLSCPDTPSRADESIEGPMPADLEKELKTLVSKGTADSQNFQQLLRVANLYLDLGYGVYVNREEKLAAFQEGARMAHKALALREFSADAHFLYAANLGSAAELEGLMAGALIIQQIKSHVQRVLELDEQYVPAHHMLGRIYEELPWFLGGDQKAAKEHFLLAVSLDNRYAPARIDLARWYLKQGQKSEAVRELSRVIDKPPLKKRWMWERIHRPQAQALLQQIRAQDGSEPSRPDPS